MEIGIEMESYCMVLMCFSVSKQRGIEAELYALQLDAFLILVLYICRLPWQVCVCVCLSVCTFGTQWALTWPCSNTPYPVCGKYAHYTHPYFLLGNQCRYVGSHSSLLAWPYSGELKTLHNTTPHCSHLPGQHSNCLLLLMLLECFEL